MFTGIVSAIGRIVGVQQLGSDASYGKTVVVEAPPGYLEGVRIGDSIAMAGACMTVIACDAPASRFTIEISAESLDKTSGLDAIGEINLEKALRAGDRLDGHLVSGHVDGVGTVTFFQQVGESFELRVGAPQALARFLALKGSIAIDGVSLTVNAVADAGDTCELSANIIPHTLEQTTLRQLQTGSRVNLEVDLIARYVERMLAGIAR